MSRAVTTVALLAAACAQPGGGESFARMGITIPRALADETATLRLRVYDEGSGCVLNRPTGGLALLLQRDFTTTTPISVKIPAGVRVFDVVALSAGGTDLGEGCVGVTLAPGAEVSILIQITAAPADLPDAGVPDGTPDAGVPDGTPDGTPPPPDGATPPPDGPSPDGPPPGSGILCNGAYCSAATQDCCHAAVGVTGSVCVAAGGACGEIRMPCDDSAECGGLPNVCCAKIDPGGELISVACASSTATCTPQGMGTVIYLCDPAASPPCPGTMACSFVSARGWYRCL